MMPCLVLCDSDNMCSAEDKVYIRSWILSAAGENDKNVNAACVDDLSYAMINKVNKALIK